MNTFCRWLHEEHHLAEPLKLKKLRVEHRVLSLLNDAQLRHLLSFKPKTFRQHRMHLAVCVNGGHDAHSSHSTKRASPTSAIRKRSGLPQRLQLMSKKWPLVFLIRSLDVEHTRESQR
jgi:hypothetical protein